MNQQLALLMALLGGGGMGSLGSMSGAGGGMGDQAMNAGASGALPGNNDVLNALRGFSPVNTNQTYGSTVSRFFDKSPLAGAQSYTGVTPLSGGDAGNNSVRGGSGHSSFLPTDFNSSMQKWVG